MKVACWLSLMILIFTPAPLVFAQAEVRLQSGPEQIPGTTSTDSVTKTKEIGPKGQVIEKEVKTSSSKRIHASYKYSGLPCKWYGGVASSGSDADLVKDTGPNPRYTVDRLPVGANPEEALWVRMRDGRMMMVDPKLAQSLQ